MQDVAERDPGQDGASEQLKTAHRRRKPARTRPESAVLAAVMEGLGPEADLRLFRNNCGVAEFHGVKVRYGLLVGSSDLIGILAPSGRLISLECKSETGRLTDEQEKWLRMVRRMGGFACVVRSVSDARDALKRARAGASE